MKQLTQKDWEKLFVGYRNDRKIMPESEQEKKYDELLQNGNYDNVNVYNLFDKYQYYYLGSLLIGSYKKGDVNTFNEIVKNAINKYNYPNGDRLSSKDIYYYFKIINYCPEYNLVKYSTPENYYLAMNANIKGNCLALVSLATKLAGDKEEFKECVKDLGKSNDENMRLAYAACIEYKLGLKDKSVRVRELAKLMKQYKEDMDQYDEHTKDVIEFINYLCHNQKASGVEEDRIRIMDGLCNKNKNGIEYGLFCFDNYSKYEYISEKSGYHNINMDLMYQTNGNKIDGYIIYNLMKSKELKKGKDFDSRFADYYLAKHENTDNTNDKKTLKK